MASQSCTVVADDVNIVQKLTLDRLEDKYVILLELRRLVFALVLGEFLQKLVLVRQFIITYLQVLL